MSGLIHIYTGDGKGKTSAVVGLAIRCAGSGQKALFTQFLKDGNSSELSILEQIEQIHVLRCEESFGFAFRMTSEEKEQAGKFYTEHFRRATRMAVEEHVRLLALDELIAACNLKLVDQSEVVKFLREKPEGLEVALTGRDPAEELVELADYVSQIVKVKHPYDKGIGARVGIER